jgi:hypothetical protein
MDEETRQKLKGLLPFSEKSIVKFSPQCYKDLGVDERFIPVFSMRGLTRSEHMDLVSISQRMASGESQEDNTDDQLKALRKIIVGWENIYDGASCDPIVFTVDDDGYANSSVFYSLHYSVQIELIGKMFEISGLAPLEKQGLKS